MSARYEWDFSDADIELRRLQDGFDQRDHAAFARILDVNFAVTQGDVHIDTLSLKPSGHREVTDSDDHSWGGHITYGGPTVGPRNPVNYAAYEQDRGGQHDFMRGTEFIDDEFVSAVVLFFERGRSKGAP